MKSRTILVLLYALALLPVSTVFAHAGHGESSSDYRQWSDSVGAHQWDAAFVLERNGTVLLRKPDDSMVRVGMEELSDNDRSWVVQRVARIHALNMTLAAPADAPGQSAPASAGEGKVPVPVRYFEPFVPHVSVTWNDTHLVVESDGMPDHPMMVGIRAWNQQVPLPQAYRGNNAFRIPINPQVAPSSTPAPYLNAIAVAVNGVPIFHPIKQDGRTDTVANGELDEYGGHSGRADDYHYHIAPRHLEKIVGEGNPVAYSLDGYPIVVAKEEQGRPVVTLDENHGHLDGAGNYSYYSTTAFPYLNISYRGVVDLENRPRALGVRPYTQPLQGARITEFEKVADGSYRLTYDVAGATGSIAYTVGNDGARFTFTGADGTSTSESYPPASEGRGGKGGGGDGGGNKEGGKRGGGNKGGGNKGGGNRGGGPVVEGGGSASSPREGSRGPAPSGDGEPRQPWILAHAAELDTDQDGAISRAEVTLEANRAFDGYDGNKDDSLSSDELAKQSSVRSAMGGFIKGHAKEVNQNGDAGLTRDELLAVATRMFDRMDSDGDGIASATELKASQRGAGQESKGRRNNQNGAEDRSRSGE
ncbi:MAG: YHYH protein [Candidatus Hydrogenedentes bacterium]|nr:YHYH protein [Candidatus Hydrogenedentota bacterium]